MENGKSGRGGFNTEDTKIRTQSAPSERKLNSRDTEDAEKRESGASGGI
jgi:hypothetical protein